MKLRILCVVALAGCGGPVRAPPGGVDTGGPGTTTGVPAPTDTAPAVPETGDTDIDDTDTDDEDTDGSPPVLDPGFDPSEDCPGGGSVSDLALRLEARDASGACTACASPVTLAVVVENPCPIPVDLTLTEDCLVTYWSTDGPSGPSHVYVPTCSFGVHVVQVPALNAIEEVSFPLAIVPGTWDGDAVLSTPSNDVLYTTFDVI